MSVTKMAPVKAGLSCYPHKELSFSPPGFMESDDLSLQTKKILYSLLYVEPAQLYQHYQTHFIHEMTKIYRYGRRNKRL
jgi:hypothetical protein